MFFQNVTHCLSKSVMIFVGAQGRAPLLYALHINTSPNVVNVTKIAVSQQQQQHLTEKFPNEVSPVGEAKQIGFMAAIHQSDTADDDDDIKYTVNIEVLITSG